MAEPTRELELARILSDGLDLCVRARRMEAMEMERIDNKMRSGDFTRSATIPMWAEEQYQADLAKWEAKARTALAPYTLPTLTPPETPKQG